MEILVKLSPLLPKMSILIHKVLRNMRPIEVLRILKEVRIPKLMRVVLTSSRSDSSSHMRLRLANLRNLR